MTSVSRKIFLFGQDNKEHIWDITGYINSNRQADDVSTAKIDVAELDSIANAKISAGDAIVVFTDLTDGVCAQKLINAYQQIRAFSNCGSLFVLPLRKDTTEAEVQKLEYLKTSLHSEIQKWNQLLQSELDSLGDLEGSASLSERKEQINSWLKHSVTVHFLIPSLLKTPQDIKDSLDELVSKFKDQMGLGDVVLDSAPPGAPVLRLSVENYSELPSRPPTLHWSEFPMEEEAQLTWRIVFPLLPPPELWVQDLISMCAREAYNCDYHYRWTNGVLLQFDTTKICICRGETYVEFSTRCDPDELSDVAGAKPEELLWKFLQPHLNCAFQSLLDLPKLPHKIVVLPYGSVYFGTCILEKVSVDLITLLTYLERGDTTYCIVQKDTSNDTIHSRLFLDKLFPEWMPKTLEEVKTGIRCSSTRSRSQRKTSNPSSTKSTSDQHLVTGEGDEGGHSPSKRRMSYEGRRRVSFGHVLIEDTQRLNLDPPATIENLPPPHSPQLAAKNAADRVKASLVNKE